MDANVATDGLRSRHPFLVAIGGVFVATLSAFLAVGAVLPVLPRYIHFPIGAGDIAVGVVIGAFTVTAIVSRPWSGRLADERGRRLVVVAGAALMAAANLLLFVDGGVAWLVVTRLIIGIGEALVFTGGSAWVVDLAPVDRRAQSIGLFGLSVWGGLAAGPALGELLLGVGGYDAVWAFAALAPMTGAVVAWRLPERPPTGSPTGRRPLVAREAIGPGIPLALANAGYAVLAGFIVLHLERQGSGHGAAVFAAFAVAMVGTRLLAGRRQDAWGPQRSAVVAGVAEAAGLALIAVAHGWPLALAGGVVMGAGFALLYPTLASVVVERAGETRRGAALGSLTAFFDAGFGLGGPLAGAVAALAGYEAAFWLGAGFGLAAAAMAWRVTRAPAVDVLRARPAQRH